MHRVLLLVCLVTLYGVVESQANFKRFSLTDLNPAAVCNDGSPATYFYRAGTGSGASIWTIYLEGGGWCYDIPSCQERNQSSHHFMTSTMLPLILNDTTVSPDVNHGGINSGSASANPHFYNANQVYLWYCSSDAHAGNRPASTQTGGFHFQGNVIIQTLIQHLVATNKQTFLAAKQVLLVGFSAGALGAMHNADLVAGLVKQVVPSVSFKTYVDSGWMFDVPLYSQPNSYRNTVQSMYTNFNMQFDATCVSTYTSASEQWRCGFPLYAYPLVETELFFAGYQFDSPFIDTTATNASSAEYVNYMRKYFLMGTTPLSALFSPDCYCHGVVAYDTRWNVITVQGTTASNLVWSWFNSSPPGKIFRAVDTCATSNCNPTCSCVYGPLKTTKNLFFNM